MIMTQRDATRREFKSVSLLGDSNNAGGKAKQTVCGVGGISWEHVASRGRASHNAAFFIKGIKANRYRFQRQMADTHFHSFAVFSFFVVAFLVAFLALYLIGLNLAVPFLDS